MPSPAPSFRELSAKETTAVLRRNHVGRMAFAFHRRVDIVPIHYVYSGGWVYGRTSLGPKLLTLKHNQWVAFEVDEIEGLFNWRSVVLHGGLYLLDPDGPPGEQAARRRAIRLLRSLVADTLGAANPVPFRDIFFRIHVDELNGRAAEQK
ncbi:MAG: pyridoxamine 5'-phosphate oxidase family protein [Gemmatimonadaceae bacterium]